MEVVGRAVEAGVWPASLRFCRTVWGSFHEAAETPQNPGCPPAPAPWGEVNARWQAHLSGCWDAAFSSGSFSWSGLPFGRKTGLETPRGDSSPQNAPRPRYTPCPLSRLPTPPRPRAEARGPGFLLWKEVRGLVRRALQRWRPIAIPRGDWLLGELAGETDFRAAAWETGFPSPGALGPMGDRCTARGSGPCRTLPSPGAQPRGVGLWVVPGPSWEKADAWAFTTNMAAAFW